MNEQRLAAYLSATPITSRQNSHVSECVKLGDRKHRSRTGCFRFDGIKLTAEAIAANLPLRTLFLKQSRVDFVLSRLCGVPERLPENAEILLLEDSLFDRISEEGAPEGVICVCDMLMIHGTGVRAEDISAEDRIVLLESVRDPSNLGAIVRSAAAFGVSLLILSDDCADIYNAKTVRASMGTLFSQRILRVPQISPVLELLRGAGRRTYAAALDRDAARLGSFSAMPSDCVIIGNEGHGLQPETVRCADSCVFIPMTDRAESLNAAVAASVLMWQFYGDNHA